MNELTKRLLSGIIYVAVLISCSLYSQFTFILLFFILMLFSLYEFLKLINLQSVFAYVLAILMYAITALYHFPETTKLDINKIIDVLIVLLFISAFIPFIFYLFSKTKQLNTALGQLFLSIIYIAVPFSMMIHIPFLNPEFEYIGKTFVGILSLIWINDTFAYLVGKNFGKTKLIERISPNKTIEGFIGGFAFTLLASYFLSKYFQELSHIQWLVIAIIVSVFGVLGDLIESKFKREAKVKDSGNFIPGHGGFLDRLDSVIFATPFIFIYLLLI